MQGKTINGFTLQRLLGVGGMAEVWYAENEIGMKVAVKIMNDDLSRNVLMRERFLNEAKVMVQLNHPNIRKVHGFGEIDGRPAIIMEYLEGSDLKSRLKQGQRFSQEELERWWNQLVSALDYTHRKGIVHRDIKPGNIFVDEEGNAKLLDFGIAKVSDTTTGTLTGSTLGTRIYMSPEQVKDPKRVGPASDTYSLAVTFVHLMTGKAPYDSTNSSDFEIQLSIVTKPIDMDKVPADWQGFLAPYLEKEPTDRPELKPFEAGGIKKTTNTTKTTETTGAIGGIKTTGTTITTETDDEGTLVDVPPVKAGPIRPESKKPETKKNKPRKAEPKPDAKAELKQDDNTPNDNKPDTGEPKSKKWLWIGLLAAAVVLALLWLLLRTPEATPKEDAPLSPDEQAYHACQTVNDYRAYISDYGRNATHYADAQAIVDQYVADSLKQVQDSLDRVQAEQLAQQKAEAEDEAYRKCTNIAACDKYLKNYPQGRYVTEVQKKKSELEAQAEAEKNAPKNGSAGGHEYIDLGLPSGTLWATCNVGANKPEDYGNYYAWGETTTKRTYNWDTYKYANGAFDKLTKYCNKSNYGNNGFTDNLTTLQSGDDPAPANWGSGWRTPTKAQWDELLNNTTSQWTTQNGVKGRLFTSKKNGQSLFLPAAGYRWDAELHGTGSGGYYWSRSLYTDYPIIAWYLDFNSGDCLVSSYYRRNGFSVRPVREK